MTVTQKRDSAQTTASLRAWLARVTGDPAAEVLELELPKEGAASESLIARVRWDGGERQLLLRVQPERPMLFPRTDVFVEEQIMTAVERAGHAPVPKILFSERDPEVLGTPFIAMEFVEGQLPPGVPSYHGGGWVVDLAPEERARIHENALRGLVGVHATPFEGLEFVTVADGPGDPLDRYLAHIAHFRDFAAEGRGELGLIDEGVAALLDNRPEIDTPPVLLWGDARPGNMIFGPDQELLAVIDWDMAAVGPPQIEVGWWLMFEEWLTRGFGHERLEGIPGPEETVATYERLTGVKLGDMDYWVLMGAVRFAIITTRYVTIQIELGRAGPDTTMHLRSPLTQMIARALGRPEPDLAPEFAAIAAASVKSND